MKRIVRFLTLMLMTGFFGSMYCPNSQGAIFKKWFGKKEKSELEKRDEAIHKALVSHPIAKTKNDRELRAIEEFVKQRMYTESPEKRKEIIANPMDYYQSTRAPVDSKKAQSLDQKKSEQKKNEERLFEGRTADKSAAEMKEISKRVGEQSWKAEHPAPARPTKPAPFERPRLLDIEEQKQIDFEEETEIDVQQAKQVEFKKAAPKPLPKSPNVPGAQKLDVFD